MEIINKETFETYLKEDKLVVVDFFATWCRPCTMLAPVLESVSKDYPDATFVKIDVDEETELSQGYDILSIPCIILFKGGVEVDRLIGFSSEDDLKEVIDKHYN